MKAFGRPRFGYGLSGGRVSISTSIVGSREREGDAYLRALLEGGAGARVPGTLFGDPQDRHIRVELPPAVPRIETAMARIRDAFGER